MTVSLALRDDSRIAKDTRARIQKIAKELKYRPNPKVAKAMATLARVPYIQAGERLAFLTSDTTENGWKKWSHHRENFEGAKARALEYGYELEPFWLRQPGMTSEKMSKMLWTRGIDGVMIAPLSEDVLQTGKKLFAFNWDHFSVVELSETMDAPRFDCVRHDHLDGMFSALHELENLGYRRIGFLLGRTLDVRTRHRWTSAYLFWGNARKLHLPVLFYDQLNLLHAVQWIQKNKLEAVITLETSLYLKLPAAGIKVPDDIGVAVLDHPSEDHGIISGIHQNAAAIGAAATDMLVNLVRRGEKGIPKMPGQQVCSGFWVAGKTTRRIGSSLEPCPLYM